MSRAVERYSTPDDLGAKFQISPETVRRNFRRKLWPATKIGGQWRVSPAQLHQIEEGAVRTNRRSRKRIKGLVTELA